MSTTITYTQTERQLELTTPLGENALLLERFTGREAVSDLFELSLGVLAENATEVDFQKLLGHPVSVRVSLPDGGKRHFGGIVRRVSQSGRDQIFTQYQLDVVPQLWLLTKRAQSRIFQQMNVPDILKQVMQGLDVGYSLHGSYEPRNYCAQYRESDFAFVSRLMEEEGIYYFFEHTAGGHRLVVADTPASHPEVPEAGTVSFDAGLGGQREDDRIRSWTKVQEVISSKVELWDHSFELPHKHLEAEKTPADTATVGRVSHRLRAAAAGELEVFDYPGDYAKRFDGIAPGGGDRAGDLQKIFQDNTRTADARMQAEAAGAIVIHGTSDCRQLVSGHRFTLRDHFDGEGPYVLLSVTHEAHVGTYRSASDQAFRYSNGFTCIPLAVPYRPARRTRKPRVEGCQTAVVVGPAGEEIFTDKYGRVKVQFHWDREGQNDENSSCWIRVASSWAGKQWGVVHIPRIGQEVLVDFLEGDPDRPIVTGSVYNAEQMPPYTLPDHKTQSGIKTRSSTQGAAENFNEIRFEDKKGAEQLYVHAEKNLDTVVENDETHYVGFLKKDKGDQSLEVFNNQSIKVGAGAGDAADGSQTVEIYKDQTVTLKTGNQATLIEKGNQTTTVAEGDQTLKIEKGKQTETIEGNQTTTIRTGNQKLEVKAGNQDIELGQGNQKLNIKMGNQTVELGMGNQSTTLKMGNRTVKLNLGKSSEEAMQSIELKVGQSSIKVDQMGVTIKGMMVKIEGQIQTEVKGLMTKVDGTAMLMAKGGITMIN
jgi:type VI secretion system secreted protein VgrG